MPGTAMAEAFQEAGFLDGGYDQGEQPEGAEAAADQEQAADAEQQPEGTGGGQQGQDTLEDIVEDLKRKNAGE